MPTGPKAVTARPSAAQEQWGELMNDHDSWVIDSFEGDEEPSDDEYWDQAGDAPMTQQYNPNDDWREQLVKPQSEPPRRPSTHRVDIVMNDGEVGSIHMDGHDVGQWALNAVVFLQPGRGPKVVLELSPKALGIRSDSADVEMSTGTYGLLRQLGWVPPAAPRVPNAHRAPYTDGTKCSGHGLPYLSPDDDRCEQCVAEQVAPAGKDVQD